MSMGRQRLDRDGIAMRAAKELQDGWHVNLGGGLPTKVAAHLPSDKEIFLETENGILGFVSIDPDVDPLDWDLYNASGELVKLVPGSVVFDSVESFEMIRGGHIDCTILGGYQVSEKGDLANWIRGEEGIGSIGGAADLCVGPKRVIVCMDHTTMEGLPRILKECTYPLTGRQCVDLIITDIAVIEVTGDGLVLKEIAPGWTAPEVQSLTGARLNVSPNLATIEL